MKIAIIAHPDRYVVKPALSAVLAWCVENSAVTFADEQLLQTVSSDETTCLKPVRNESEAIERADIVVVIGGDGTMLYAAQKVKDRDIHMLGINCGRLGFIANIQQEQIASALTAVKERHYTIDERFMLRAEINGKETWHALNEFLFTKKDTTSLITITAQCDDLFINRYWADGLLVATPTGSTAYNLSTGGPIVMPGTPVIVLTPINPHTLTTRPLVLPSDKTLTIKVEEEPKHVLFSVDGRISEISADRFEISVKKSDNSVKLIQLKDQNYFDTLRNKLMWGVDLRRTR